MKILMAFAALMLVHLFSVLLVASFFVWQVTGMFWYGLCLMASGAVFKALLDWI